MAKQKSETQFIDSCSAARIAMLSQEQMTTGAVPISVECGQESQNQDMHEWVDANLGLFHFLLADLECYEQDLLLSYFLIHKSQESLGRIFNQSQTNISKRIGDAVHRLSYVIRGFDPYPRKYMEPQAFPDYFRDPPCLGQFRIDLSDPDFDKIFIRASNPQGTIRDCSVSLREDR